MHDEIPEFDAAYALRLLAQSEQDTRELRQLGASAGTADYEWGDTVNHAETLVNEGYPYPLVCGGAMIWARRGDGERTLEEFREYIDERVPEYEEFAARLSESN